MEFSNFLNFLQTDGYYDSVEWDGIEVLLHSSKSESNPFCASEFVKDSNTRMFIESLQDYAETNQLKPFVLFYMVSSDAQLNQT